MIIIFSFPSDNVTNKIIEWLKFYKCDFKRINLEEEDYKNIEIQFSDNKVNLFLRLKDGFILNIDEVDYFLIRGAGFDFKFESENKTVLPKVLFNHYIQKEYNSLVNLFYTEANKKSIGCFYTDHSFDKLTQLKLANEVGLKLAKSIITSKNNRIREYFNQKKIITKAIYDNIAIDFENYLYVQRVQRISEELNVENFFPSFLQEEIEKKYEIRSFYLEGDIYTIAIYSDCKQNVDSRYNYDNSIYTSYKLPDDIENKIRLLMNKLRLNSGSFDFIKSIDDEYFFIEINPTGQYDWVSVFGNYDLHNKIAKSLVNKLKYGGEKSSN